MEGGGFAAAARPSIVRKELVALLLEIEATCPLKEFSGNQIDCLIKMQIIFCTSK